MSVKCYFGKWLTSEKKAVLAEFMQEYDNTVNFAIETFERDIFNCF